MPKSGPHEAAQLRSNSELRAALRSLLPAIKRAYAVSFVVSVLMLAPSLYMMQLYDRVVTGRSITTLLSLIVIAIWFYALLGVLEWSRTQIMRNAASTLEYRLQERVFDVAFKVRNKVPASPPGQALVDLRVLKDFISSPVLLALLDAPLSGIYIAALFLINPWVGAIGIGGLIVQLSLLAANEHWIQPALVRASRASAVAQNCASDIFRGAQLAEALGMEQGLRSRWVQRQNAFLYHQARASDLAGAFGVLSRFAQTIQTSLLMGVSCWLMISGVLKGGWIMMMVASMLGGRALAQINQLISSWKSVAMARESMRRLEAILDDVPAKQENMKLPDPAGRVAVESVFVSSPGMDHPILRSVRFEIAAGEAMAIIGPSGAGKSSLARVLVGAWQPTSGKVRLDGADLASWSKTDLGPHIGYLPQGVGLFRGTVAENIARFGNADRAQVEEAARAAGIHEMILTLADGYDTDIGEGGAYLSGGQVQLLGLARAIYGFPRLLVLDEPNSSLDRAGELALEKVVKEARRRGATVVIITHRTPILQAVDKILFLRDGVVKGYGPRDEVLGILFSGKKSAASSGAARGDGQLTKTLRQ